MAPGLDFSMNKYRHWETVPTLLNACKPDEVRVYPPLVSADWLHRFSISTKVYGFFDDDGDVLIRPTKNVIADRPYLRDDFYRRMQIRREKLSLLKNWVNVHDIFPSEMIDPRLSVTLLWQGDQRPGQYFQGALVQNMNRHYYWAPHASGERYLVVDLHGLCRVSGIGTKGRFPKVDKDDCVKPSNRPQWTCRYNVFYRTEKTGTWLLLDTFAGNTDENTEVTHNIVSPCGALGLLASQLRIQPIHSTTMAYGAMRIAVYGECLELKSNEETEPGVDNARILNPKAHGVLFVTEKQWTPEEKQRQHRRGHGYKWFDFEDRNRIRRAQKQWLTYLMDPNL